MKHSTEDSHERAFYKLVHEATQMGLKVARCSPLGDRCTYSLTNGRDVAVGLVEVVEIDVDGGYGYHSLPLFPTEHAGLTYLVRYSAKLGVAFHRTAKAAVLRLVYEANDDRKCLTCD